MDIKAYIEDLFKYLDTFESRYPEFDTEAFLQTYNGIYTVFKTLRQQRDDALDVDRYFLERIKKMPLTSSDLRQLVIQVLITYFESEADTDGQSNKAYLYCRDLRPSKRDITFFEEHLIPLLFRDGALNNNYRLHNFILREIARYINKFCRPVDPNLSPEAFAGLSDPHKFLELMQRRMALGDGLLGDRASLEFHLQRIDVFNKLGRKNKLFEKYLTEWKYLSKTSFWTKMKSALAEIGGKIKGTFTSFRYFRLVMTQRRAAYLFYGIIIVVFIFLAFYVPSQWSKYYNRQLEKFQKHAVEVQQGAVR
ncbi:MAG: hypothetical protein PHN52_02350 [candidate division Zixibacteria bacterium]|nr:hypothetical protein [candidate division Zixibacteria bacterium]